MLKQSLDVAEFKEITETSFRAGDSTLVEKVYRAFRLLEILAKQGIDFVFKGGSAVMLLLDEPQRFSIDVDIVCKEKLSQADLVGLTHNTDFGEAKEQERSNKSQVPKFHFKVPYKSVLKPSSEQESSIVLDLLCDYPAYPVIQDTQVALSFFPSSGDPVIVKTPTVEGICGDKLTAFAPSTVGIPYLKNQRSCALEIVKQMFDVGCLFQEVKSLQDVANAFDATSKKENQYRGETFGRAQILQDILNTSLAICTEGKKGQAVYEELRTGIMGLKAYVFSRKYTFQDAKVDAARVAYLAALILCGEQELLRFEPRNDLTALAIPEKSLNVLKKSAPEAFYYWYKIFELAQSSREPILSSCFE